MKLPSRLLALSLLGACAGAAAPASAQILGDAPLRLDADTGDRRVGGSVDGFFVLDNRLVADDGETRTRLAEESNLRGGGVAARLDVFRGVFLTGEYRRTTFNRAQQTDFATGNMPGIAIDSDLTTIRGGAGIGGRFNGIPLYVRGEYSSLDLTGTANSGGRQNGYGVLAGVSGALNRYVGVEGEAGYQDNRDFGRGLEYRVGGWLNVLPNLALTLHYRRTRLEHGSEPGRAYLETGGAGIRFQFGGAGLPPS